MQWGAERDLRNELFEERYLVYNDWDEIYSAHWKDRNSFTNVLDEKIWSDLELARFEKYPQCTEDDERALRKLLGKLGMTGHGVASLVVAS